jgi:hypothetical protein
VGRRTFEDAGEGKGKAMNRRLLLAVVSVVLIAMTTAPGMAGADPAGKTDVCHYDADTGLYHLINISENALRAHLNHGDSQPGDEYIDELGMGWRFLDDCTLDHWWWMNYGPMYLSPQTVQALGGAYDNPSVQNAINQGYVGTLEFTEWATPELVEYWFDFANLAPFTTYEVFLDSDGGSGGPWELLGTFTTDASGVGEFDYGPLTFPPGTELQSSFWINENGFTVLKTDFDVIYTTH